MPTDKRVRGVYLDRATLDRAKEVAWAKRVSVGELFRQGVASFLGDPGSLKSVLPAPPNGPARFSVKITDDTWEQIRDAAWSEHYNISEAIRLILKKASEPEEQ